MRYFVELTIMHVHPCISLPFPRIPLINVGCVTLSKPDYGVFQIADSIVLMQPAPHMSPANNAIRIVLFVQDYA